MKAHWRKASLIAAAFSFIAGLAPSLAQAAPLENVITSVVPYGNVRPSDWNPLSCASLPTAAEQNACLAKGPSSLFANSQARARYQKGLLWITGNADITAYPNGLFIDVEVTDGTRSVFETYATATADNPDFGVLKGDFVEAGDVPSINVTDLGTHWAGTDGACKNGATAAGCDPKSLVPADWGASILTVKVTARDPATGNSTLPWMDGKGTLTTADDAFPTITKYAGTPVGAGESGDAVTPAFVKGPTWMPRHWCHTSSRGAQTPSQMGPFGRQHLGGDYDGRCGTLSNDSAGALPDVTWLVFGCYPAEQFPNPWPADVRSYPCRDGQNSRMPTGEVSLTGTLSDDVSAGFGTASEIGDINIEFFLGNVLLRPASHSVVRNGPQGGYGQKVRINDFEPNYTGPGSTVPYTAKVTFFDAWGNSASASTSFTIYPW